MLIALVPMVYSNQFVTSSITTNYTTHSAIEQSSTTTTSVNSSIAPSSTITSSSTTVIANNTQDKLQILAQGVAATAMTGNSSLRPGFNQQDLLLINSTANLQINFIESLQMSNGAIIESPNDQVVYTRDISLAIIALTLSGHLKQASLAVHFLISLQQGTSNYTGPGGQSFSSPAAWSQVYSATGRTIDPSLRGEDQGMALFAISTYVQVTGDASLARDYWNQIQSSANFILYLQHSPEPSIKFNGLYRHGDNWHDSRIENMNASRPIYWPFWPEYYQWEEENMRMINGLRGAITLAKNLGFLSNVQKWNDSLNVTLVGLSNESMYNKYEAYDYFGSVLWGIQTNLQAQKNILASIPSSFFTPYGVKDLPWENYASISDTIDYMVCLVRVGNYSDASRLLNVITTNFIDPHGGFYDSVNLNGSHSNAPQVLYSSARFVYFQYVVSTIG